LEGFATGTPGTSFDFDAAPLPQLAVKSNNRRIQKSKILIVHACSDLSMPRGLLFS
jgi:hypothetical protein